jgi:hypothetical protein
MRRAKSEEDKGHEKKLLGLQLTITSLPRRTQDLQSKDESSLKTSRNPRAGGCVDIQNRLAQLSSHWHRHRLTGVLRENPVPWVIYPIMEGNVIRNSHG